MDLKNLNFEKMDDKLARANNPQNPKRRKRDRKAPDQELSHEAGQRSHGDNPYYLEAKKSLGQNFLRNKTIIKRIVDAGEIVKGEIIVEIGPGTGELTEELLKSEGIVIAIEKDSRAIPILESRFKDQITAKKLIVIEGDFLEMDISRKFFDRILGPDLGLDSDLNLGLGLGEDKDTEGVSEVYGANGLNFKIIANIPYYITGLIIRKSLELAIKPKTLIFLVQKEVAERITVKDGKTSILSHSIDAYGDAELLCIVSKGNFAPAPKVDSAVIVIRSISDAKFVQYDIKEEEFFLVLHAGFAHKRKKLLVNLIDAVENLAKNLSSNLGSNSDSYSDINRNDAKTFLISIFEKINLDENVRAEEISNEKWFQIAGEIIHK